MPLKLAVIIDSFQSHYTVMSFQLQLLNIFLLQFDLTVGYFSVVLPLQLQLIEMILL